MAYNKIQEEKKGLNILIGDKIKKLRKEKGLSQSDLAKIVGVTDKAVSTWECGSKIPRMGAVEKMVAFFGVTKSYLLTDDESNASLPNEKNVIIPMDDVAMVPIVGRIPAGIPLLAQETIVGYQPIPMLANADEYFCLRVSGDSMVGAGIPDGSVVLIRKQNCADDGNIVACMLNSDDATLKRYKQVGDTVLLIPENPKYKPFIVPVSDFENGTARIIGVAAQVITTKSLL